MKRFHVHVSVEDLAASIRFYHTLDDAPMYGEERKTAKEAVCPTSFPSQG